MFPYCLYWLIEKKWYSVRGSCKFGSRTLAIVINDVLASILTSYFQRCFIIITTILTLTLCSFKKKLLFWGIGSKGSIRWCFVVYWTLALPLTDHCKIHLNLVSQIHFFLWTMPGRIMINGLLTSRSPRYRKYHLICLATSVLKNQSMSFCKGQRNREGTVRPIIRDSSRQTVSSL